MQPLLEAEPEVRAPAEGGNRIGSLLAEAQPVPAKAQAAPRPTPDDTQARRALKVLPRELIDKLGRLVAQEAEKLARSRIERAVALEKARAAEAAREVHASFMLQLELIHGEVVAAERATETARAERDEARAERDEARAAQRDALRQMVEAEEAFEGARRAARAAEEKLAAGLAEAEAKLAGRVAAAEAKLAGHVAEAESRLEAERARAASSFEGERASFLAEIEASEQARALAEAEAARLRAEAQARAAAPSRPAARRIPSVEDGFRRPPASPSPDEAARRVPLSLTALERLEAGMAAWSALLEGTRGDAAEAARRALALEGPVQRLCALASRALDALAARPSQATAPPAAPADTDLLAEALARKIAERLPRHAPAPPPRAKEPARSAPASPPAKAAPAPAPARADTPTAASITGSEDGVPSLFGPGVRAGLKPGDPQFKAKAGILRRLVDENLNLRATGK